MDNRELVVSLMTAVWNRAMAVQKMRAKPETVVKEEYVNLSELTLKELELKDEVLARMMEDSPLTK